MKSAVIPAEDDLHVLASRPLLSSVSSFNAAGQLLKQCVSSFYEYLFVATTLLFPPPCHLAAI